MFPVLFRIAIPAGWGKPVVALVVLAVVVGRAVAWIRRLRRAGEEIGVGEALRDDAWVIGALVVAAAGLWSAGVLDGAVSVPVHSYGLLIAAGFLAGVWLAKREAARRGQDGERIADLAFWIAIAALVGSRVYFIAVNPEQFFGDGFWTASPVRMPRVLAIWEGGLVFYGGLIGAALVAFVYMRRHRMAFLPYADTIIPSVALGHFFGRLGCFSAGCCWGGIADAHLPWAVRFPEASLAYQTLRDRLDRGRFIAGATTVPLHPTQLYESFGELALFLVLILWVRPRKRFHGEVLATWLLLYAVLRTTVEAFRGDVERGVVRGLGVGQWTSMVIFAAGAALWAYGARRREAPPAAEAV